MKSDTLTPAQASFLNRIAVLPEAEAIAQISHIPPLQTEHIAKCCGLDPASRTLHAEIHAFASRLFAKYLCHV